MTLLNWLADSRQLLLALDHGVSVGIQTVALEKLSQYEQYPIAETKKNIRLILCGWQHSTFVFVFIQNCYAKLYNQVLGTRSLWLIGVLYQCCHMRLSWRFVNWHFDFSSI
jgi:hypothetical protein